MSQTTFQICADLLRNGALWAYSKNWC